MWSELIAKQLPSEIAWGALNFYHEISLPYNESVDLNRESLFDLAVWYFKVEGKPFAGLDTPQFVTVGGNPVVLMPNVMTKRCFNKHMDIQQTWYYLCGLYDGAIRAMNVPMPEGYKDGYERFARELSKYAAELAIYGKREDFANWVKEHGMYRIHEHLGHPYSIFGFYLAKSVPGVTAVSYNLNGGMVSCDSTTHLCDIPCNNSFSAKGSIIHSIGDTDDIELAEQVIIDCGLGFSEHTEMIHKNDKIKDAHDNSVHVEIVSYLMGVPVSAHLKNYYLARRTVAILIRAPELVNLKRSAA